MLAIIVAGLYPHVTSHPLAHSRVFQPLPLTSTTTASYPTPTQPNQHPPCQPCLLTLTLTTHYIASYVEPHLPLQAQMNKQPSTSSATWPTSKTLRRYSPSSGTAPFRSTSGSPAQSAAPLTSLILIWSVHLLYSLPPTTSSVSKHT